MHYRQPTELTIDGVRKLQSKLRLLKNRHKSLTDALRERTDSYDLLDDKHIERDFILSEISKVQAILSNVTIMTKLSEPSSAIQGVKVTYKHANSDTRYQVMLVGPHEADPFEGLVSIESPVGSSLLGHQVGDNVIVPIAKGNLHITILALE